MSVIFAALFLMLPMQNVVSATLNYPLINYSNSMLTESKNKAITCKPEDSKCLYFWRMEEKYYQYLNEKELYRYWNEIRGPDYRATKSYKIKMDNSLKNMQLYQDLLKKSIEVSESVVISTQWQCERGNLGGYCVQFLNGLDSYRLPVQLSNGHRYEVPNAAVFYIYTTNPLTKRSSLTGYWLLARSPTCTALKDLTGRNGDQEYCREFKEEDILRALAITAVVGVQATVIASVAVQFATAAS